MITVTAKALTELKKILQDGECLRLGVRSGGCSGMMYIAAGETAVSDDDVVLFEEDGVKVVAHEGLIPLMDGLKVDFSDDLVRGGFRLTNQNMKGSCGCGASFSEE